VERNADTEFRGTFLEPPYFEDLSERAAVKLTSMLRLTGRPHYTLWANEIGGVHFKERTGQFFPIYYLDIDVTDVPVETREPLQVDVRIRLGKHLAADGSVERLISEAWTEVTSPGAHGGRLRLGGTHKQAVFTRPDPDPEKRKVRVLHPSLGLGDLPRRMIRPFSAEDVSTPSPGWTAGDALTDRQARVWSYQQTDPNGHVHAMEYVRVMEAFAADELARRGLSPRTYHFARARVLFRRPCFTGEWYRRTAGCFSGPDGAEIVVGAIHALRSEDGTPEGRPATVVQLWAKKSLQSSVESDKGPNSRAQAFSSRVGSFATCGRGRRVGVQFARPAWATNGAHGRGGRWLQKVREASRPGTTGWRASSSRTFSCRPSSSPLSGAKVGSSASDSSCSRCWRTRSTASRSTRTRAIRAAARCTTRRASG
jgi:hypothetical protein